MDILQRQEQLLRQDYISGSSTPSFVGRVKKEQAVPWCLEHSTADGNNWLHV
jgi:hypothetical protein